MVTARGRRELERTASWSSVRSGLGWLIGVWLVLTVASVAVQLQGLWLAPGVEAKEPGALALMSIGSAAYQLFYVVLVIPLVVALVRLTRVPPATRAVTPALVATASFVVVGLASLLLLLGLGSPSSDAISARELWLLVAAARALGLAALLLALARMAAALAAPLPQAALGGAFAFALIDAAFPLHRLLTGATGAQPAGQRSALLVVQIALCALLIELARRARGAAARAPAEPAPPPEPEVAEPEPVPPVPSSPAPAARTRGRTLAASLVFLMVALFPCWDALSGASSVGALSAAVRGAPGTEPPATALLYLAGALAAALVVRQLLASSPYGARAVYLLALMGALVHALPRTWEQARYRSSLIDAWPVCETGLDHDGNLPRADDIYRGAYDGPRLPSGEPCTRAAERRDQHEELSPRGDFSDGIVQIGTRFPDDRRRVLWGWLALSLIAGTAGWFVFRAAHGREVALSQTSPGKGDPPEAPGLPEESPRDTRRS